MIRNEVKGLIVDWSLGYIWGIEKAQHLEVENSAHVSDASRCVLYNPIRI